MLNEGLCICLCHFIADLVSLQASFQDLSIHIFLLVINTQEETAGRRILLPH